MKNYPSLLLPVFLLGACATQTQTEHAQSTAINQAITICGIGSESQVSDIYKAAFDITLKKSVSTSFEATMTQSIKAEETALLQSIATKSPDSSKAIVEEIDKTRECVIEQTNLLRPQTRADALEACRLDVQHRISPPGPTSYGVVRYWNQLPQDPEYSAAHPIMSGLFDSNGTNSFPIRARCDMPNGRFEEATILPPKS
ncbi:MULTISPECIES: hypothetical protein [Paraburkholderia]|jgi:hypothetical protein|uniref:Lipoprotein n=2 Tax=Paraburkholderia TaxID=1822464 RepID=A0A1G7X9D7_9BURK|nr:hypothetical protein [Paraburkholderia phenazinium]SDG80812.1 hypothetical protein SAMN05216466_105253 [Paraburkholderia phenazinium]